MQSQDQLRHPPSEAIRQRRLSPKQALNKNKSGVNSAASRELNIKPKKQPSDLLNLFTALKKEPNLYEKRENERKLAEEMERKHQMEEAAQKEADHIAECIKKVKFDAERLKAAQEERTHKIDKTEFSTLKNDEGIYYGQTVQILPAIHKPADMDKVPGFRSAWSADMLMVEDISQVSDELKPLLLTVRHGFGIQIYAN